MSIIAGAISGVLAPVIEGIISRRPAAGAPGGDPAETELRALLATAGDVWTLDEAKGDDAVGLFNGLTLGSGAAKSASPLIGGAMFNNPASVDGNQPLTGDQTTALTLFNGGDFSLYGWLKYTSGGTAKLLSATSGGVEFLTVSITGTTCNFQIQDIGESQYSGSCSVPTGINTIWTQFVIQRISGDLYIGFQNSNGITSGSTSGGFGTNQNWSGGSGKLCEMGSAGTGCTISLDQILYIETSSAQTDVQGYWYNNGAGRALIP